MTWTEFNIERVRQMVISDHRLTVQLIIAINLGMRYVCDKMVLKLLNDGKNDRRKYIFGNKSAP